MSGGSYTFTLTGNQSNLDSTYFPPIELASDKNYVIGLVDLHTYNSIPNIYISRNKFYVGEEEITIPEGSYEIEAIEKFLQNKLVDKKIDLSLKANNNTLRCEILCNELVDFTKEDSIYKLLGFTKKTLKPNETHYSDQPIDIIKINTLRIECNIIEGAYINGQRVYTIHEFFPSVSPGYKIIEIPKKVIDLPVRTKNISLIQLRILDQNGDLVNFRGENITIRLHLKSL